MSLADKMREIALKVQYERKAARTPVVATEYARLLNSVQYAAAAGDLATYFILSPELDKGDGDAREILYDVAECATKDGFDVRLEASESGWLPKIAVSFKGASDCGR